MKNDKITQLAFIKKYIDENREEFNEELFRRSEDDIIEELKKVILSCQKNKHFCIKVIGFEVVEDYNRINEILEQYENNMNRNKGKKKKINQFEYVNLRESDIKLLIIKYYIRGKSKDNSRDEEKYLDVLLAIPRVVNKYYFRISGNLYSSMYQLVDGSTYNNLTSSNRRTSNITLKSYMPPIRIYKYTVNLKEEDLVDPIECNLYQSIIFNKRFPCILYHMAKFGYLGGLQFLGVADIIKITKEKVKNNTLYNFKENDMYVSVPKSIFNVDPMVQSIVVSLLKYIPHVKKMNDIFTNNFWIERLGAEFSTKSYLEKGDTLLDSVESIYDIGTKESIRLPMDQKESVYHIMRWMMREFINLKNKNNLNIGYKKIRNAEYIASFYSMKLCNGIYRISGKGSKVTLNAIETVIKINPMFLLRSITKCRLINYRDLVNDLDGTLALQFTYKGISGIGDSSKDTVPEVYRFVHPSHLGRIDPDSSHKSDPGMSGIICPLTQLYDKSFSDYEEPNYWEENMNQLIDDYKKATGLRDLLTFEEGVLKMNVNDRREALNEGIDIMRNLLPLVTHESQFMEEQEVSNIPIPLEDSGIITAEI